MRIFLIILNFFNIILYYTAYAYFDNILNAISGVNVPVGLLNFAKLLILVILGFLIGLLVMLLMNLDIPRHYFGIRTFIIVGIIPAIGLLLSEGTITNFIVTKFFNSNKDLTELVYYFFSRSIVWTLWLGFSIGVSVRIRFKKRFKHQSYYKIEDYNSKD